MRYIPADAGLPPEITPDDLRAANKRDLRELRRRMERARRFAKQQHQERLKRAAQPKEGRSA